MSAALKRKDSSWARVIFSFVIGRIASILMPSSGRWAMPFGQGGYGPPDGRARHCTQWNGGPDPLAVRPVSCPNLARSLCAFASRPGITGEAAAWTMPLPATPPVWALETRSLAGPPFRTVRLRFRARRAGTSRVTVAPIFVPPPDISLLPSDDGTASIDTQAPLVGNGAIWTCRIVNPTPSPVYRSRVRSVRSSRDTGAAVPRVPRPLPVHALRDDGEWIHRIAVAAHHPPA